MIVWLNVLRINMTAWLHLVHLVCSGYERNSQVYWVSSDCKTNQKS